MHKIYLQVQYMAYSYDEDTQIHITMPTFITLFYSDNDIRRPALGQVKSKINKVVPHRQTYSTTPHLTNTHKLIHKFLSHYIFSTEYT